MDIGKRMVRSILRNLKIESGMLKKALPIRRARADRLLKRSVRSGSTVRLLMNHHRLAAVNGLLQLPANLRNLLHLLHRHLVALQSLLNDLRRLLLAAGQLFQRRRILLLLVQKLLVHLGRLLGLIHQLMNRLLALVDLVRDVLFLHHTNEVLLGMEWLLPCISVTRRLPSYAAIVCKKTVKLRQAQDASFAEEAE